LSSFAEQWAELPRYVAGHVQLTLIALMLGIAFSLPLGIAATRRPRLETWALGVASVLQTVPGLALLALMVPLLGVLGRGLEGFGLPAPPSIGFLPAMIALSLYSVLPMLRNTVTGIAGVDPALREAARGVGMNPREVLWQVELPLALPTIVAGVRTATVWVVGMATLATPVGGVSLGNPIFAGLQTRNLAAVVVGSLAAAMLALGLDGIARLFEIGLVRRSRPRLAIALLALLALAGWASGLGHFASASTRGQLEIRVGSKPFTEQFILAEILAGTLERDRGVRVKRVPSLGSTVAFDGLASGEIDVYVDYTGTLWSMLLKRDMANTSRAEILEELRIRLLQDHGIEILSALGFENTYCLAMREAYAQALGIERISDLVAHAREMEILADYEFFERPEWAAIESRYGLRFGVERAMDSALMYEAIRAGSAEVISAYSTDGRIAAYGLRVIEDDLGVIPPYDAVVLGSGRLSREAPPALLDALRRLEGRIPAAAMRRMNSGVDLEGRTPSAVAREWLGGASPGSG
jgi:osmoprotectant transport system permease protein